MTSVTTLYVLGRQNSERGGGMDVGDLFCLHFGTKYANFQEKISAEISGKYASFCPEITVESSLENWRT